MLKQMAAVAALSFLFATAGKAGPIHIEPDYTHDRFDVAAEQVVDGIYMLRRSPSWRTSVQGNVTVIINDHDVVVVDGGHPPHVKSVIKAIKSLTDKPVSRIITTHWHQDHNWGNFLYKKAWPDAKIISHINTQKTLAVYERVQKPEQYGDQKNLKDAQVAYEKRIEKALSEGAHHMIADYLRDTAAGLPSIYKSLSERQNGIADITFDDKLTLTHGTRTIELLYLGRANTDGDTIIWLPKEKIVVTGDIIVQPTPYGFGSYPSEWDDTIERILGLNYTAMIPGHGPLIYDGHYPRQLIGLLRDITAQTEQAVANGASTVEELAQQVDFTVHDKAFAEGNPLYAYLFQNWFKKPILISALKEARGEPILQTQYAEE